PACRWSGLSLQEPCPKDKPRTIVRGQGTNLQKVTGAAAAHAGSVHRRYWHHAATRRSGLAHLSFTAEEAQLTTTPALRQRTASQKPAPRRLPRDPPCPQTCEPS